MLEAITKLLTLQERDQELLRVQNELAGIKPQRDSLHAKLEAAKSGTEAARAKLVDAEGSRKKIELEVEAQKQLIAKYSVQQMQTKKNEEYKALGHQIETCQETIRHQEDEEIGFMEQAERAQHGLATANTEFQEIKKHMDKLLADLANREESLKRQLASLETDRAKLASGIEEGTRVRYERLLKHKGEKVVVGVDRGVCGGCHMTLPPQSVIACQSQQELVNCPNCSRILYYSSDMDLTVAH